MASFIPLSFQKRILRYALSRVDILDAGALDLDRLDIGWRKTSTLELRNVALRKDKVASLLKLPLSCIISSACVATLKISVPPNLYSSPIEIQASGISVRVRIEGSPPTVPRPTHRNEPQPSSHDIPSPSPKDCSPGGDSVLPTPQNLAESFLEQETPEKKAQLEAELTSDPADLSQSSVSIDTEEGGYGYGMGLALPTFLAGFLKGLTNRLRLTIDGIKVEVDVTTEVPETNTPALHRLSETSSASFLISIGSLESRGATESDKDECVAADASSPTILLASSGEVTHRLIKVKDIDVSLASELSVFDRWQRLVGKEELRKDHISPTHSWTGMRNAEDIIRAATIDKGSPGSSHDHKELKLPILSPVAHSTLEHSLNASVVATDPDKLEDSKDDDLPPSPALNFDFSGNKEATTDASRMVDTDNGEYAESGRIMSGLPSALRSFKDERKPSPTDYSARNYSFQNKHVLLGSNTPPSSEDPSVDNLSTSEERGNLASPQRASGFQHEPPENMAKIENLTESKMFTAQEAESIYMSVLEDYAPQNPVLSDRDWSGSSPGNESSSLQGVNSQPPTVPISQNNTDVSHNTASRNHSRVSNATAEAKPSRRIDSFTSFSETHERYLPTQKEGLSAPCVSKRLFRVSEASMWIPVSGSFTAVTSSDSSPHQFSKPLADHMEVSGKYDMPPAVPGAFSSHADATTFDPTPSSQPSLNDRHGERSTVVTGSRPSPRGSSIQAYVSAIDAKVDIPLCALVLHTARLTLQALRPTSMSEADAKSQKKNAAHQSAHTSFSLDLATVNICLQDQSIHQIVERNNDGMYSGTSSESSSGVVDLAALSVNGVRLQATNNDSVGKCKATASTVRFRVADQDVLQFRHESTLKASVKASRLLDNNDLFISYVQTHDMSEVNVTTLPVQLKVDLHSLNESLASFGGVSGLLEVGSLVLSDSVLIQPPKSKSEVSPRPRTVRFETTANAPLSTERRLDLKANIRIGGSHIDIKSKECVITCKSSAIKVVARQSINGLQIDQMELEAQSRNNLDAADRLKLDIDNFGLKYLSTPEEQDLSNLVSLLAPSRDKFSKEDDLLVETLLKQRRNGAVARMSLSSALIEVPNYQALQDFQQNLVDDLLRLSHLRKYLPKENRPGLLLLGSLQCVEVHVREAYGFKDLCLKLEDAELAYVGSPLLVSIACGQIGLSKNSGQTLIHAVLTQRPTVQPWMLMARVVGDEPEPAVKIKLFNMCFEYDATLLMDLAGIQSPLTHDSHDLESSLPFIDAKQDLGNGPRDETIDDHQDPSIISKSQPRVGAKIDLSLLNCAIGLTPRALPSKGLFTLAEAKIRGSFDSVEPTMLRFEVAKASLLLIDDTSRILPVVEHDPSLLSDTGILPSQHIPELCKMGYVSVCWLSAAEASIKLLPGHQCNGPSLEVEVRDELLVLETCADSTQTLSELLGALQPPASKSTRDEEFRTEIAPLSDMMASFSGESFSTKPRTPRGSDLDDVEDELDDDFDYLTSPTETEGKPQSDESESTSGAPPWPGSTASSEILSGGIRPTSMPTPIALNAYKWESGSNRFSHVTKFDVARSACRVRVQNVHIIWNLHDGYDWPKTRDAISKAVHEVELKTEEKRVRRRAVGAEDEDDDPVINDFLFNSIYIGVPVSQDPHELPKQINKDVDEDMSDIASNISRETGRTRVNFTASRNRGARLRLERSKRQKLTFELQGVSADFLQFAPGSPVVSSTSVKAKDLDVFDHVPTSTWRKFATYQRDAGPREEKKPMVQIDVCDVKPVLGLAASELVLRVTVLPLRLHIDQDALDFLTRFFEFQDDTAKNEETRGSGPYLQRLEVLPVMVKLDYKPKKVDYAGLKSGRTKEFMNFFNLDGADIVLKHAILYGCPSFSRLHQNLEDIWMPDIKSNQLPGILSGLNGVRTIVNVGGGFRNLLMIPVEEYQKDGRVIRSVSKGAAAFARTTGSELTRFGARLAIGAQTVLQGAEGLLAAPRRSTITEGDAGTETERWADGMESASGEGEKKTVSHFADQPAGILQGLRGAARSLERDLLVTRDAIIAVSGEIRESESAEDAALAVARHAPTVVLRPMIGASKAISQTLMGATNSVDPENRLRVSDKYKRY